MSFFDRLFRRSAQPSALTFTPTKTEGRKKMPTLLAIETSPRGDYSISRNLTSHFVENWRTAHAGGTVNERDLQKTELPFVDLPWIAGAYTPAEQHSPDMKKALAISDELIGELKSCRPYRSRDEPV